MTLPVHFLIHMLHCEIKSLDRVCTINRIELRFKDFVIHKAVFFLRKQSMRVKPISDV